MPVSAWAFFARQTGCRVIVAGRKQSPLWPLVKRLNLNPWLCFLLIHGFIPDTVKADGTGTNLVRVIYGILPSRQDVSDVSGNRTVFRRFDSGGDEAFWTVADWRQSRLELRLLGVGTNAWEFGADLAAPYWVCTNGTVATFSIDVSVYSGVRTTVTNGIRIFGKAADLPLDMFGRWENSSSGTDKRTWYQNVWSQQHAVSVLYDPRTHRANVFSDTPDGTSISGQGGMTIVKEIFFDGESTGLQQTWNSVHLPVVAESKKVYIGASIPPLYVWMADFGLKKEDIAAIEPKSLVDTAIGMWLPPTDSRVLSAHNATMFMLR